jgi:ribosome-binding factor A
VTAHKRPERVAHLLQQRLAELLARGLKDPRLGLVTITGVKMSPDLREARVFWTAHGEAEVRKETARGLSAARGYLRHELSTLGLRVLPELHFTYDEAIDRGDRIERLLREVHEADEQRSSEERALPATGGGRRPEHTEDGPLLPEKE